MSNGREDVHVFGERVLNEDLVENIVDDFHLDDVEAFLEYQEIKNVDKEPTTPQILESMPRWRAAKSIGKLRAQVDKAYRGRSRLNDGIIGDKRHCPSGRGKSDHCPNIPDGDVGVVTAIDITHDIAAGCDADKLANAIREKKDSRIKYVIWNQQIYSSYPHKSGEPWTWRSYSGHAHDKHVHISVLGTSDQFDNDDDWDVPTKILPA